MSSNINQARILKTGLAALIVLALVGCEELPGLPVPPATNVSADVVTDSGRGGYHWRLNGPQFETLRPTVFQLVETIDPEVIKRNLQRPKPEDRPAWTRPEAMEDDVYFWFRRFMEPQPAPRLIMELQRSDEVGVDTVCFNRPGTRLLTVAKKLIEWDVQTGKRSREFDAPIADCKMIAYDPSHEQAFLQNEETLVKVSLADGRVLHSWKPPRGQIESFETAAEADAQAVVTKDGNVFALSDNFQQVTEYKDKKFTSKRVSIHPKGLWILGVAKGAPARWRLDQPSKPTEVMVVEQLEEDSCVPMAGIHLDRWADTRVIHELEGTHEWLMENSRYPFIMTNAFVLSVGTARLDEANEWIVILGEKYDSAGKASRFVQDFRFDAFEYSIPWPIPVGEFQELTCDATWERLGFLVGSKLSVFERRRWGDPDGWGTAQRMAGLFAEGRIEQLELCASELRNTPIFLNGRRGSGMYEDAVSHIAEQWMRLESQPASDEVMEKIAEWHKSGSELALLASAQRHLNIGAEARGGGYADTVTAQGWATLGDRNALAYAEIKQLLDQGKVSPTAVVLYLACATGGDISYEEAEPWLIRSVTSNPDHVTPLANMCNWLLPRWGGNEGEAGALVGALTARYPAPDGDMVYARSALVLTNALTAEPLQFEAGFSLPKILDAVDPILTRGNASRLEVELLMEVAQQAQRRDVVERLGQYHIEHFGMPAHHAYQHNLLIAMLQAREASLEKARSAKP